MKICVNSEDSFFFFVAAVVGKMCSVLEKLDWIVERRGHQQQRSDTWTETCKLYTLQLDKNIINEETIFFNRIYVVCDNCWLRNLRCNSYYTRQQMSNIYAITRLAFRWFLFDFIESSFLGRVWWECCAFVIRPHHKNEKIKTDLEK